MGDTTTISNMESMTDEKFSFFVGGTIEGTSMRGSGNSIY